MGKRTILIAAMALGLPGAALAQPAVPTSTILDDLARCRATRDDDARLRCFDAATAQLGEAGSKDLVVVSKEEIRKTRRSLFGFTLPSIKLFSNDDDKEEAAQEIASTVKAARRDGYGKWMVTLADDAVWQQTDTRNQRVREGDAVTVRRAALGSYLMNVGKQNAMRVRRER